MAESNWLFRFGRCKTLTLKGRNYASSSFKSFKQIFITFLDFVGYWSKRASSNPLWAILPGSTSALSLSSSLPLLPFTTNLHTWKKSGLFSERDAQRCFVIANLRRVCLTCQSSYGKKSTSWLRSVCRRTSRQTGGALSPWMPGSHGRIIRPTIFGRILSIWQY